MLAPQSGADINGMTSGLIETNGSAHTPPPVEPW